MTKQHSDVQGWETWIHAEHQVFDFLQGLRTFLKNHVMFAMSLPETIELLPTEGDQTRREQAVGENQRMK